MRLFRHYTEVPVEARGAVVALGNFDGLHRGHQAVIAAAAQKARQLGTSGRTLQRRLAQDGVTFQGLLQDARRELARHYLLHSALELNETAYLLGYEDAHSFFRAFHAWEGSPPGEWRARQAALLQQEVAG